MDIGKKVAYLKGLAEGLDISSDSKNGKIIKGILDVLEDIAASIEVLEDENAELEDYITEIDDDLGMLEQDFEKACGHKLNKISDETEEIEEIDEDDEIDEDLDLEDIEYLEEDGDFDDDAILDGIGCGCPHCHFADDGESDGKGEEKINEHEKDDEWRFVN